MDKHWLESDNSKLIGANFTYTGCPVVELQISGNCPVQAFGKISDYNSDNFYFRARHNGWRFEVYDVDNKNVIIYSAREDYGEGFDASWMPMNDALRIIGEQIRTFWLKQDDNGGAFRRIKQVWGEEILKKYKQALKGGKDG